MARIRSIKIDLFVDDSLAEVSLAAHLLLAGLPVLADSAGRLEDRPRRIQAQLLPYRAEVDVNGCLDELAQCGALVRYEAGGVRYIEIASWERDQRPHVKEAESVIPAPPHNSTEHRQGGELAGNSPGTRRGKSAGIRDSGLGILDLGSESLGPADADGESPNDLQALWNAEADPRLPRWRDMTEKRRKAAAARLKERPLAEWRLILGRINGSPFCLGVNDRGWTADVEFFLRPETATRALEGKYDAKPGQALPGKRIDPNSEEWVEA